MTGVAGRTEPGKIFGLRHLACEPCCHKRLKTRRWHSSASTSANVGLGRFKSREVSL